MSRRHTENGVTSITNIYPRTLSDRIYTVVFNSPMRKYIVNVLKFQVHFSAEGYPSCFIARESAHAQAPRYELVTSDRRFAWTF